jgi:dipeptidyl aminopeptidase/acylaminoacyl peptidase
MTQVDPARSIDPEYRLAAAYLANPTYSKSALSPDGSLIAAIRTTGDADRIVIIETAAPHAEREIITEYRSAHRTRSSRVIRKLGWPSNDRIVYSIETPYGSREDGIPYVTEDQFDQKQNKLYGARERKTRLYASTLDGKRRYLARHWQWAGEALTQDEVIDWLWDDPDHFMIRYAGDAILVHSWIGTRHTVQSFRNGVSSWVVDHRGVIRAGGEFGLQSGKRSLYVRAAKHEPWKRLNRYNPDTEPGFWFAGFSENPNLIYVYSDEESDSTVLYEYHLDTKTRGREVFQAPPYDLHTGTLRSSPLDGRLLAINYFADRPMSRIVDPEWARRWKVIADHFRGQQVLQLSENASTQKMLFQVSSEQSAPMIWLHDSEAGTFDRLFDLYPGLEGRTLAETEAIRFKARDGSELHGYLTRLPGAPAPAPVIVYPHDEPNKRVDAGWNPVIQYLASSGYAVLQLNYRGSVGFGRLHERRRDRQWGDAIQDDFDDAVQQLIAEGIAAEGRIGIYGQGFGGYIALHAVVKSPSLYSAAGSWGAVTDLSATLNNDGRSRWKKKTDRRIIGDRLTDPKRLTRASPLHQANRIKTPVLIGYGTQDDVVDPAQSEWMVRALEDNHAEVEAYRYQGEPHRFIDERNRIDFYRRLTKFFDRHLKDDRFSREAKSVGGGRRIDRDTASSLAAH